VAAGWSWHWAVNSYGVLRIGEQMRQEVIGPHEQRLERILRVAKQPGD
jgi:hypothetical protein